MAKPILVTGAAGRVGAVGRTVTDLLLRHGHAARAMVRHEDERAQALRDDLKRRGWTDGTPGPSESPTHDTPQHEGS